MKKIKDKEIRVIISERGYGKWHHEKKQLIKEINAMIKNYDDEIKILKWINKDLDELPSVYYRYEGILDTLRWIKGEINERTKD